MGELGSTSVDATAYMLEFTFVLLYCAFTLVRHRRRRCRRRRRRRRRTLDHPPGNGD